MGYASALAWVLFLIVLVLTFINFRAVRALGSLRGIGRVTSATSEAQLATPEERAEPGHERRPPRALWKRLLLYLTLILVAVVMLFPGYWMWVTAVTQEGKEFAFPPAFWPDPIVWENFPAALTRLSVRPLLQELALHRGPGHDRRAHHRGHGRVCLRAHPLPGPRSLVRVALATLMLPFVVTMVPRFIIFRELHLIDTPWPLIVPFWFGGSAFAIFLFRQYFRTLPYDLDEAAKLDGASHLRISGRSSCRSRWPSS